MKKILVVSQKELVDEPIFRQDKNLTYVFDILTKENTVDLLYLHKNIKIEKDNEDTTVVKSKYEQINKICIRDIMSKNMLQKNLKDLINKNKYEEIVFMSYNMAQFVMPYIEEELDKMVVIVDYRLSNLSYVLQQYKEEKQKKYNSFHRIYKEFRMNFLQSMIIFQKGDYFIFDNEQTDTFLIEKEGIKNIICVDDIDKIGQKKEIKIEQSNITEIEINSDNFSVRTNSIVNKKNDNFYVVNESKYFNLVDTINDIIYKSKSNYFFIHKTKLDILPNTSNFLSSYLSSNKNLAVVSPLSMYSRNNTKIQQENDFDIQRKGNYCNWEKTKPLQLSDCFMIKKSFLKKYGYFDSKFKTIDYALFDFLMRIYQKRDYYCTTRDITIFKLSNLTRRLDFFKEDRQYLCYKWGENNFLF